MAEIDRTGLDILCKAPGDVYLPPKDGLVVCIKANGEVIICDNKTDKCSRTVPPRDDRTPNVDAMTVGLLKVVKELTERVANLESKRPGRKKKSRKPR